MTPVALVLAAAALTYVSRAVALAVLPAPRGRLHATIERVPAPLFAGLAVFSLLGSGLDRPSLPVLLAAVAALACTRTRSLAAILAAGMTAYVTTLLIL